MTQALRNGVAKRNSCSEVSSSGTVQGQSLRSEELAQLAAARHRLERFSNLSGEIGVLRLDGHSDNPSLARNPVQHQWRDGVRGAIRHNSQSRFRLRARDESRRNL